MLLVQLNGLCCNGGKASIRFFPRPNVKITVQDVLVRLKRSHLLWSSSRVECWLSTTSSPAALDPSFELPPQATISLNVQMHVKPSATPNSPNSYLAVSLTFATTACRVFSSICAKSSYLAVQLAAALTTWARSGLQMIFKSSMHLYHAARRLQRCLWTAIPTTTLLFSRTGAPGLAQIFSKRPHIGPLAQWFAPGLYCESSIGPTNSPCPSNNSDDNSFAIEITGYIPNGQRRIPLVVSNSTTFASVLDLLVAKRILPKKELGSFYLAHGVWGRTKPLSLSEKLWDKGVQHHPTLFLGLRIRGGSAQRRRSVFVDIPPAPYPIPTSSSSVLQPTRHPLQDTNRQPSKTSKRKRSSEDVDGDLDYAEPKIKGKGKENTLNHVSRRRKKTRTVPASSEDLPTSSDALPETVVEEQLDALDESALEDVLDAADELMDMDFIMGNDADEPEDDWSSESEDDSRDSKSKAKPIDDHISNSCSFAIGGNRTGTAFRDADDFWRCYCNQENCRKRFRKAKTLQKHIGRGLKKKDFRLLWTPPNELTGSVGSGSQPTAVLKANSPQSTPTLASAFQPGCNSSTGALTPVEGRGYECAGIPCKHSPPHSWKDIDWSSRTQEAEFDELDTSCLALEELNMCVYKPLNMILCRTCQKLLDDEALVKHLRNDVHKSLVPTIPTSNTFMKSWTGKPGEAKRDFFVEHIKLAYNFDTSFPNHAVVHRPIPFMPAPETFDHCPACMAAFLNKKRDLPTTKRVLQGHFKQHKDCDQSEAVKAIKTAHWTPGSLESWEPFTITRKYGQLVYPGCSGTAQRVVYLPEGWAPSTPISTTSTGDSSQSNADAANMNEQRPDSAKEPIIQDYVEKLGWYQVFTTSKGNLIDVWKQMLTSVPVHPTRKYTEEQVKQEAALEGGLLRVRGFLLEYLQDANKWVKGCSEIFRRQITQMEEEGSKSKKSRSMYRLLAPTSLDDYKDALYDSIALLLRYKHVLACGKVDVGQRLRAREKKIDQADEKEIDLHLSMEAVNAMNELYSFLVKVEKDEEILQSELAIPVHKLLLGLLTSQASSGIKVGSLFEFVTALKSYRGPEKGFGPASLPSRMCSMLTYGLRSIVVHVARLGGGFVAYLKPTPEERHVHSADKISELEELVEDEDEYKENGDDDEDEDDDEDAQEHMGPEDINQAQMRRLAAADLAQVAVSSPVDEPNSGHEDPEDELIPDPYDTAAGATSSDNASDANPVDPFTGMLKDDLLSTLREFSKWISNNPSENGDRMPSAFQRIRQIWLIVWPLALKVVGSTRVIPDEAGLVFKYSNCYISDHDIKLADLKSLTESLITEARERLLALLPSGLDIEKLNISLSTLHDDMKSDKSVFEQDENKRLFQDRVEEFMAKLMEPEEQRYQLGQADSKKKRKDGVQSWFDADHKLLESILGGMVLSTGIPARAFQIEDFRYVSSSTAEYMRHVFICKQNVVIGFPKSKLYSRTIQEALWALPPGLSQTLILYLGVIRPVSIRLMTTFLRQKPRRWSASHIFAPAHSPVWRRGKINAIIKSYTLSALKIKLTVREIRQLITAIFRKHLPSLIEPVDSTKTSTANKQGDHSEDTANQYGQVAGYMTGICMPDTEVDNFIKVSHGWQALLGIRSPGQAMQALLHKLPAKALQDGNRQIAMDQVRILLVDKYGLGGPDWARSRTVANEMLKKQPFMPKAEDGLFGDEVLVSVSAALLYGHGTVNFSDSAPVEGLAVDTVLEAVALIRLGLKEWTGNRRRQFNPMDVLSSIVKYKLGIGENMRELATEVKDNWRALGLRVFDYVKERHTPTNGLDLMDNEDD